MTRTATTVRLRPRSSRQAPSAAPHAGTCVFTSVEGTLLDAVTLEAGPSRDILRLLHEAGVPVVPVTAMTLEEMDPLARTLGLRHPMIVEAGGAIARWRGRGWEIDPCGPPADTMLDVVREIEERSGADLLIVSALPDSEVARLCGLVNENVRRSAHRCFSEPFLLESGDLENVKEAARSLGFSIRRGRRFLHLCRACDRGEAFTRLREELRCEVAVAIGSSPLDAEFLGLADLAIVMPRSDGQHDPELLAAVPHAQRAPVAGPAGWAASLEQVMQRLEKRAVRSHA